MKKTVHGLHTKINILCDINQFKPRLIEMMEKTSEKLESAHF